MNVVRELLRSARSFGVPSIWEAQSAKIREERTVVEELLFEQPARKIYGFNTLPGHRESSSVEGKGVSSINAKILGSHLVGSDTYFDPVAARCIGYARLYAIAAGGSGISEALYAKLIHVVSSPDFNPSIPIGASYSSGDVITCAHWANEILRFLNLSADDLEPGEVMVLINGRSAQVGFAAALIFALEELWCTFASGSELFYSFEGVRRDALYALGTIEHPPVARALEALRAKLPDPAAVGLQESVSIRALPQVLECVFVTIDDFIREVDASIFRPSCNPLFQTTEPKYLSQASFLAPLLTTRASSIIDAVLFMLTNVVGRLTFILSGAVDAVRIDGSGAGDLGLIQIPKLLSAELDSLRLACGARWSGAHISTSHGLEDVASYGLIELDRLQTVIEGAIQILNGEIAALECLTRHPLVADILPQGRGTFSAHDFVGYRQHLRSTKFARRENWAKPFFPLHVGDFAIGH